MSNRLENFIRELVTYGDDFIIGKVDSIIKIHSEKTDLRRLRKDLKETADYYNMAIGRLSKDDCEFITL